VLATLLALTLLAEPVAAPPSPPATPPANLPATSSEAAPVAQPPAPAPPAVRGPIPLPPPPQLGSPFARATRAAVSETPPEEVTALLEQGRTLLEARRADLDLDGSPEWVMVASYLHPDRIERGPRSAEWRAGQRIETRATHELVIAGRERGAWKVRFAAELRGSERQALFVEPLARADGKPARWPVVITGARACLGSCGPVELHLVIWDPARRALGDYAWADVEFVQLGPDGAVEAWFADRRPGDPICCPSGYAVMELAVFGAEIDVKHQRAVPADRLRRLLPPGRLIERVGQADASGPAAGAATHP
jgi:hypothetical protein